MKIAIIDDGVADNSISLPMTAYAVEDGDVIPVYTNKTSIYSHGTACAKIIAHNLTNAEIISISIYSEFSDGNEDDLIVALRWCLNNHVDFINLSNGSTSYFNNKTINELCYKIRSQGTILVAAVSNDWVYTTPACLPYVIGASKRKIFNRDLILADVEVSGWLSFRDRRGHYHFESHNSFACARLCNRFAVAYETHQGPFQKTKIIPKIFDFSLLMDVYGCSISAEIDVESLAFRFRTLPSAPLNKDQKITLLVTADFTSEALYRIIVAWSKNLILILWCNDVIPKRIKKICDTNQVVIWTPCKRNQTLPKRSKLRINTFTIAYDPMQCSLNEILSLKKELTTLGYNVLAFSTQEFSFLYNFINENNNQKIEDIVRSISPDVIIIEVSKGNCTLDWDVNICHSHLKIQITTNEGYIGEFDDIHAATMELIHLFATDEEK